jgi:hypothetical protein
LPKGGTIRLNTRAIQTNTAGRTIYNQALEKVDRQQKKVRVKSPRDKTLQIQSTSQTSQHRNSEYRAQS